MPEQDKILNFLRITGPTIPSRVAKNLNTEILFASAHLSDLAAQGKVKISQLKIGGTPLYYLSGQEAKLYDFAQNNLNPKDFQVLELLKKEKVLREQDLELLPRVALRALKDFAIPLNVTVDGQTELFWKWYLLSNEETKQCIDKILNIAEPQPEPMPTISEPEKITVSPQEIALLTNNGSEETGEQDLFIDTTSPIKRIKPKRRVPVADDLLETVERFFQRKDIVIEQKETIRKNAELNFIVKVPSVIGSTTYFCKVKHKQKCDEKDLAAAYMEAQTKKIPLFFLYTNEVHKKAQEMIDSNAFENAIIKRINHE